MATVAELFMVFRADTSGASAETKKLQKELGQFARNTESLGNTFSGLGAKVSVGLSAPLVAIGAATVNTAASFEQSFNKITALAGISGSSLDRLRTQALKLGADTQFSAQEAADAMVVFGSAGFNAEKIYSAMPGTLALAAAGQLSVAAAATLTKDVLGEFGLKASESGHVADVLAQASADASASLSEMGQTLTYVGPVAKGAGQSLEETSAAIIALDAAGIRGEKAGTGLRGVLASLLAPSSDAAKAIDQLGINVSDSTGHIRPLSDIMEQFRGKLANVGNEAEKQRLIFEIFGREAGNAAQVLIDTGGPALDAFEQKLTSSAGAAQRMADTINKGTKGAIEQFEGSIETAGIALGTALLPSVNRGVTGLTGLVNNALIPAAKWFGDLPEPIQNTAIGMAALTAAAGPTIFVTGQLISSFGSITGSLVTLSKTTLPLFIGSLSGGGIAVGAAVAGLTALGIALTIQAVPKLTEELGTLWANITAGAPSMANATANAHAMSFALDGTSKAAIDLSGYWSRVNKEFTNTSFLDQLNPIRFITKGLHDLNDVIQLISGNFPEMDKAVKKSAESSMALATSHMKISDAALNALAASRGLTGGLKDQDKATSDLAGRNSQFVASQKSLNEAVEAAEAKLALVNKAIQFGTADTNDLEKAQRAVEKAFQAAHPEFNKRIQQVVSLGQVYDELGDAMEANVIGTENLIDADSELGQAIDRINKARVEEAKKAQEVIALYGSNITAIAQLTMVMDEHGNINGQIPATWRAIGQAASAAHDSIAGAVQEVQDMARLGVPALADLQKKLDEDRAAYERLDVAVVGVGGKTQAYITILKEQIAINQQNGESTEELERQLEKLEGATKKNVSAWAGWGNQVSTIATDAGKQIVEGFKGLFDNSQNEELAKQAQELAEALEKQTKEYTDHVADLKTEFAKSTANLKTELDKQLADVKASLEKRRQEYDRDVEDITTRAQRQTRDLREELSDRERDYQHYIQDQQLQLRELEGDNSESAQRQRAEIQLSLQQRAEDMADYRADVQVSLSDIEADLTTSLTRQAQDYDQYTQDAQAQQSELTTSYEAELAKQTEQLQSQLEASRAEYETFKNDTATQLAAIEAQHQSTTDKIGTLFATAFSAAGEALGRFVTEKLEGILFKKLADLADNIIPSLTDKLGGLFGIGGGGGSSSPIDSLPGARPDIGTLGGIPGLGGGGGGASSAASSAVGGVMGIVGAVGSVVSAISSVISNFQLAKQETTLNAIEASTRILSIAMIGFADTSEESQQAAGKSQQSIFWFTKWTQLAVEDMRNILRNETNAQYLQSLIDFAQWQLTATEEIRQLLGGTAVGQALDTSSVEAVTAIGSNPAAFNFDELVAPLNGIEDSLKGVKDILASGIERLAAAFEKGSGSNAQLSAIQEALKPGITQAQALQNMIQAQNDFDAGKITLAQLNAAIETNRQVNSAIQQGIKAPTSFASTTTNWKAPGTEAAIEQARLSAVAGDQSQLAELTNMGKTLTDGFTVVGDQLTAGFRMISENASLMLQQAVAEAQNASVYFQGIWNEVAYSARLLGDLRSIALSRPPTQINLTTNVYSNNANPDQVADQVMRRLALKLPALA